MSQTEEQDKIPEKELSEEEVGNLRNCSVLIVKVIRELGRRMEEKNE